MPIQKQAINLNFQQGLDTKTDPRQVSFGKFLSLNNSVFDKGGRLTKRNGFGSLPSLPDNTNSFVTTFNGDLTAIGTSINAYSDGTESWITKGTLQPLQLSTLTLIRNNTNQSWADIAISGNLVCTAYTDQSESNLSNPVYKFAVADNVTGQNFVSPTIIVNANQTYGSPRVFTVGNYFLVMYAHYTGSTYDLQYIAINAATFNVGTPVTFAVNYQPNTNSPHTIAFDGITVAGNLYIAFSTSGGKVNMTYFTPALAQSSTLQVGANASTYISLTSDTSGSPVSIWLTYYSASTNNGYVVRLSTLMQVFLADTAWTTSTVINNIATTAINGVLNIFYEVKNAYGYDSAIPTNYINFNTVTNSGTVGTPVTLVRSVGLASKGFIIGGNSYFASTYESDYQSTVFLMNIDGEVIARFAYSNGGGYLPIGLPNSNVVGTTVYFPYLYKDLIEAVNKGTAVPAGTQVDGIYSQTGINMVSINITTAGIVSSEIGNNLNVCGGILWAYDGYSAVEQNFNVWPDSVEATWSTSGGSIHAQPDGATNTNAYYYQVTYEWTDNQGNAFRSAPSIPVFVTTTGSGTTGSITLNIPTLRLTYKIANPVKIVVYRWSVAQEIYYQTTSIEMPVLNDTTIDYVTFVDTNSDATILGNNIIYTTGGVIEDIGPPPSIDSFLFDDRLWLIDAEDQNLLWYSKQVIESTPVEMSDLFTFYVAPTLSAQGSSGTLKCGAPMDDKAILFKKDAIYYFNGSGPDNTGANSQYSQPIFVTSAVGCENPNSIVLMPNGLMFQSDKGIWLLGRDLSTSYIGAPVEEYNSFTVTSAVSIPGENQVRFTLNNGTVLMYDYYYGQWGTFSKLNAISSTLYQSLQTYIDSSGDAFQETPGLYIDGSNPVLMSFTTSWLNMAGVQGYQRAYFIYLLGKFLSPHYVNVTIAYDYNPSPVQSNLISPDNTFTAYGDDSPYGQGSPYGGTGDLEIWRVFLTKQKCVAFQISISEVYNATQGIVAGAGLTLTGVNIVYGIKKAFYPIAASNTVGGS